MRYPDDSRHYAVIVQHRSWILGRHREYLLYTGRDPKASYGHTVKVDFTGEAPELRDATWEQAGVRVRFTSGHEVYVPARYFTGGR
ncbi:hypothetical protein [Thermomonospora catenispora]|uniref:hypothetical protein n=1 Tax=Thermomonospora catenispora TaxID=2493090 RepID=UPI0011227F1C|nr:hypothetical protein [Thermomonospora catenispora]TNY35318.1 hypothetical protein EIO00_18945 [Thermomonospora catenispora]